MMKTFLKRSGVLKGFTPLEVASPRSLGLASLARARLLTGFTLIELLVVIAIIGILASIVLASLNTARLKSRDARRIADIKSSQLALELFFDSCAKYPVVATAAIFAETMGSTACSVLPATQTLVTYLTKAPKNPTPGGADYMYLSATGATYTLTFTLEGTTGTLTAGAHTASPSGISN